MIKSLLVLIAFLSLCLCKVPVKSVYKFDVDVKKLKNIWESPELKPALNNLEKKMIHKRKLNSKILQGNSANPGQFPFHVLLAIDYFYECGGSLIKPNWVLTVRMTFLATFIVFLP